MTRFDPPLRASMALHLIVLACAGVWAITQVRGPVEILPVRVSLGSVMDPSVETAPTPDEAPAVPDDPPPPEPAPEPATAANEPDPAPVAEPPVRPEPEPVPEQEPEPPPPAEPSPPAPDPEIPPVTQAESNPPSDAEAREVEVEPTPDHVTPENQETFRFGDYLGTVQAEVGRAFRPPPGSEGTVRVRFTLDRDGQVTGLAIVGRSGNAILDVSALAAVESPGRRGRFGPLPDEYPHQVLTIDLAFRPDGR